MSSPMQLQTSGLAATVPGIGGGQRSGAPSSLKEEEDTGAFLQMLGTLLTAENGDPPSMIDGEGAALEQPLIEEGGNILPVAAFPAATIPPAETLAQPVAGIWPDSEPGEMKSPLLQTSSLMPQTPVPAIPRPLLQPGDTPLNSDGEPESPQLPQTIPAVAGIDESSDLLPAAMAQTSPALVAGERSSRLAPAGDISSSMVPKDVSLQTSPLVLQNPVPDPQELLPQPTKALLNVDGEPELLQAALQLPQIATAATGKQESFVLLSDTLTQIAPALVAGAGSNSGAPAINFPSLAIKDTLQQKSALALQTSTSGKPELLSQLAELSLSIDGEPEPLQTEIRLPQMFLAAASQKESPELLSGVIHQTPSVAVSATGSSPAPVTPSPSLLLSSPMNSPQWQNSLGERMIWLVKRDIQQAELSLNPRHLGPVEVRIEVRNEQASITFSAHHAVTRDALEAAVPRLREMLGEAGLALANADVSQQQTGRGQQQEGEPRHHDSHLISHGMESLDIEEAPAIRRAVYGGSGLIDLFV